jgi:hypothetical protein
MLHHDTQEAIARCLYFIDREKKTQENPIISVIEKALEFAKNDTEFSTPWELLDQIKSILTEEELANDERYYSRQETDDYHRAWLHF